jgi:hydroxymethylpyrimidine/phosphomethylpyrimidine kinase
MTESTRHRFVESPVPKALTIAGSDSGGGAGIQADLKTFAALGVYGTSVLTAITAQNTLGVFGIHEIPVEMIAAQIDAVMGDIGADAAKTGMLSSAAAIGTVAAKIREHGIAKYVCDPVMVSKSGHRLLREEAVEALRRDLLPLALVVTPNIPEAEALSSVIIEDDNSAREAARRIAGLGPRIVVIKGGHRSGEPVDVVFDGETFEELPAERIATKNTHGTGCTFSAAIAAGLAKGLKPRQAICHAKIYITEALRTSYPVGAGHGPVNHFHPLQAR